jgi:hypothetical protein
MLIHIVDKLIILRYNVALFKTNYWSVNEVARL